MLVRAVRLCDDEAMRPRERRIQPHPALLCGPLVANCSFCVQKPPAKGCRSLGATDDDSAPRQQNLHSAGQLDPDASGVQEVVTQFVDLDAPCTGRE